MKYSKNFFILISNLLLTVLFVWVFTVWNETYVSHYYPNVAILDSKENTDSSLVSDRLESLATETNSLIAVQHQTPGSNGLTEFSYTTFGSGSIPEDLKIKKDENSDKFSVETNYFIFSGTLQIERLEEELNQLGLTNSYVSRPTTIATILSVFGNGFPLISVLTFILAFASLTLIGQIGSLRSSGIRLISGESNRIIFLRTVKSDLVDIFLSLVLSLIFTHLIRFVVSFPSIAIWTIVVGLLLYNLFLLGISLIFALVFAGWIKNLHLMQVIKGRVPLRGMVSLLLFFQLLAIIMVSIGIGSTYLYSKASQQQKQGMQYWSDEKSLTVLSVGREGVNGVANVGDDIGKETTWYHFMNQTVKENKGFLVYHQLVNRVMQNGLSSVDNLSSSTSWDDYTPTGNVLMVTPDYFKQQNIKLPPETVESMKQLSQGQFSLLLPESLKDETDTYKSTFETELTNLFAGQDTKLEMEASVSYLENGNDRFVYNTTPFSYQQFLRDPIFVVVTPESTGPQSVRFWSSMLNDYFFFKDLSSAQELVQLYGLKNWVGELGSAYHNYLKLLGNIQREVWTMFAGALLGITTSVLTFITMNRLYFEDKRRSIFIKRISGMNFFEIHRWYLLAQLVVLTFGFLISSLLVAEFYVALSVFLLFICLSYFQLLLQMKQENKLSTVVLKGG